MVTKLTREEYERGESSDLDGVESSAINHNFLEESSREYEIIGAVNFPGPTGLKEHFVEVR